MAKKLLSMLLALSIMLAMLAACNNDPVDPVGDPNDQQQEENKGNEGDEVDDGKITLVADGLTDYVIVRGENAYISEVNASTELQSYIKQISGVEIPIVTDSTAPVEKEIVVGKTNREADGEFDREELGNDGFVIKSNGKKLFLVGGEQRGTLYSVYEFLEAYLGCRFYTSTYEKIPEIKNISLEEIKEDKQIPIFDCRDVFWYDYTSNLSFAAKRKVVGKIGGVSEIWATSFCHTIHTLAETGLPDYDPNPCMTDENLYQTTLKNVKAALAATPNADYISISQSDNREACGCDNCNALLAETGSHSGIWLTFVNRIANEIKDEYPNVKIHTFAYMHTETPPTSDIVPAENVMIEFCTFQKCQKHAYNDPDCKENRAIAQSLSSWAESCDYLAVWDYTTNFSHYNTTVPNLRVIRENIRFFAENNVKHLFEQGNYTSPNGEFEELRGYLLSKLVWNPYMSEEEYESLIVEFLKDYYGAGWEYIHEFINLSEESSTKCFDLFAAPEDIYPYEKVKVHDSTVYPEFINAESIKNYENVDWSQAFAYYQDMKKPEIINVGRDLFEKALAEAETEEQKWRIQKSSLQIEFMDAHFEGVRVNTFDGLRRALSTYFTSPNSDFNVFTPDEQKDISKNFYKKISVETPKYLLEYADKNKALAERFLSFGIIHMREVNGYLGGGFEGFDFTKTPHDWIVDD